MHTYYIYACVFASVWYRWITRTMMMTYRAHICWAAVFLLTLFAFSGYSSYFSVRLNVAFDLSLPCMNELWPIASAATTIWSMMMNDNHIVAHTKMIRAFWDCRPKSLGVLEYSNDIFCIDILFLFLSIAYLYHRQKFKRTLFFCHRRTNESLMYNNWILKQELLEPVRRFMLLIRWKSKDRWDFFIFSASPSEWKNLFLNFNRSVISWICIVSVCVYVVYMTKPDRFRNLQYEYEWGSTQLSISISMWCSIG